MIPRHARPEEADALAKVMYRAIHEGPGPYSPAQRRAWRDSPHAGARWRLRLAAQDSVLVVGSPRPQGVMTLRADGYIDLAFLLPEVRHRGAFRALLNAIEARARTLGLPCLWTHASLMAEGPFRAFGFTVTQRQVIPIHMQRLRRARMEKRLAGA